MDVSIIIVNYNTCVLLRDCLNSIQKNTNDIEYEIIISDNGSKDGSIEMIKRDFPSVILLENNKNLGFGTANNRGLDVAKGKYILYLNSDTLFLNNALKYFYDYMELHQKENIGALGSNLIDKDKSIIHSYGRFPTFSGLIKILIRDIISQGLKFFLNLFHIKKEHFSKFKHSDILYLGDVDYITGADLFLKNNLDARYDENYILYYEETDLQKQLEKKGLKRRIIDGPQIVHLEGGSNQTNGKKFTSFGNLTSYISMAYYCKKNISLVGSYFIKLLIFFLWLNPLHFKITKDYFKRLIKI